MLIAGLTLGVGILAVFLAIIYRISAADDKPPIAAEAPQSQSVPDSEPVWDPEPIAEAEPVGEPAPADNTSLPPVEVEPPTDAEPGSAAPRTPAALLAVEASIPADARLVASTVAGGRIVLTYDHFAGTIVIVVDPDTLQIIGQLDLKPQ